MSKLKYIILITFLCLFVFSSCKIGKKYKQPELEGMPESFVAQDTTQMATADIGWSTLYKDPVLQELIDRALEHNRDLKIAGAKIKEAIATKRISFANLFPEIGVELAGQEERLKYGGGTTKVSDETRANLSFRWELDVWGKLRWAKDADIAAYMQTVEAQRALHLTIVSQVAQAYFELKALDRKLAIVKQTLKARREGANFAKIRYEGGLTSEIPYRQSLVELARTETLIPQLENDLALKENQLAILVGEYPSALIPRGEDITMLQMPPQLPVELPSSLLKRRPDVLMAEQKLIEANAKVGVALTGMFPSINLSGRLGFENDELSQLLKSPTTFISGVLLGPIFQMGKNKAKHKAAQAVYEQEVYNYEKAVVGVFSEVNGAIITYEKMQDMRISNEALYNSTKSYYDLARLQYVNGIINYIDVLDSQRQLFDAEIALNNAILNELTSMVFLYKALGGGLIK